MLKLKLITLFVPLLALPAVVEAQIFTTLHSFTNSPEGANPFGRLVCSGKNLYGTTLRGGLGAGTMFKLNTNGVGFAILHTFTGDSDGYWPYAGLTMSGNTLFGATRWGGGTLLGGTVLKVNTNGAGFTSLHNFTTASDGASPVGDVIVSGNTLYGTTIGGGTWGNGTIFKLNTNGLNYTNLYSFTALSNSTNGDGANPYSGLALFGNTLYGTAYGGGSSGNGVIFMINTNGAGFTNMYSFSGGDDGSGPYAGLTLWSNVLYGTTQYGGTSGNGTAFKINTDGTGFTNLHSFSAYSEIGSYGTNSDGASPTAGLMLSGNTLFGTAAEGGSSGYGTVFAIKTDGTSFTVLYSFSDTSGLYPGTNSDGCYPYGGLASSGNTLYGTAYGGGSLGNGTVFSLLLPGTFTDLMKPTLTITNLAAGQRWSNAVFTVKGIASDNVQVSNVWFQANSNGWQLATSTNGWTNWTAIADLIPGTNVVQAYAVDTSGNKSATNSRSMIYVLSDRLQVRAIGQGTISPNYSNAVLEVTTQVKMRAKK